MPKLLTTKIVGTPTEITWSQAQTVDYGSEQKLMLVIQLTSQESDTIIDLASVGAEMVKEIEIKGQKVENLGELQDLVKDVVATINPGLSLDILIAKFNNNVLQIGGSGNTESYLAREGKLAKLGFGVQGELKDLDRIVLATTKLVGSVGMAKFREILTEDSDPSEALAPLVHMQDETSGIAGVVGQMETIKEAIKWPQIRLRSETPRKMNLWVGGVILTLLVIMIGVGMVRRVKIVNERVFNSLSESVGAKLSETVSVGDLNPDRAKILLTQAKSEIESYMGGDITDQYKSKAGMLLLAVQSAEEKAFKKNEIELNTIVELPILQADLVAEKMKSDGKGNLVFLNSTKPNIVSMNIVDRSRQVIEIKDSGEYIDIGVSEAKVYGLHKTGVNEFFWKKDDVKKSIEADEFWKTPTKIALFGGNIYVLDTEQSEIWKYPVLTDSFGSRRRWLAAGITPDLSKVVDMKVVGDIWLLTASGKIERYSRGAPSAFSMEGFPAKGEAKKFSEPVAMHVTESLVYVLEQGMSRVVVLGVDGKYQSQYVNSEFAKATDLVIVDDKGYVLVDNTVKVFGL